jgi:hypothetical protein
MKIFLAFVRHSTRIICILLGVGLPIVSVPFAFLAAGFPQKEPFMPAWKIVSSVVSIASLLGSGFAMFAIGWRAHFANSVYRRTTFVLLLFPLGTGAILISSSRVQFPPLGLAVTLTVFTGWLLLLCVKPTLLEIKQHTN